MCLSGILTGQGDCSARTFGLVGDSSSSLVALVVRLHFNYSHHPTIGSVWSCSVMLGTRGPLEGGDGAGGGTGDQVVVFKMLPYQEKFREMTVNLGRKFECENDQNKR